MKTNSSHLLLAGIVLFAYSCSQSAKEPDPLLTVWYDKPATIWEEALPIGNGRLGAMIFGDPYHEKLQLNDVTVWSGHPRPDADRKNSYRHLPEIRKALRNKELALAHQLTHRYMTCNEESGVDGFTNQYFSSYQTLGNLNIEFNLPEKEITQYKRWLNLEDATSGIRFNIGNESYTREIFASAADSVIVLRLKSTGKGGLNFTAGLNREHSAQTTIEGNTLVMKGNTNYNNVKGNCNYEARIRIEAKGGKIKNRNNQLTVTDADEACLFIACGTSYVLDYDKGYRQPLPAGYVNRIVETAAGKGYDELFAAHQKEYQSLFKRMDFYLGQTDALQLPTDKRLENFGNGENDPAMITLFYQYGRYLMISASRENNPLPANSQGIWGDGYELPWHCDYKSNINYQMNYWSVEPGNLSECHMPMLRLNASLVKPGRNTARNYFNAPGWVMAMMTNAWGWTSPGWEVAWGSFFGGSGWLCHHFWEHYAYTQDKEYLRWAYPIMKEACEFYLAAMTTNAEGNRVMSPSSSPENGYFCGKDYIGITEGSTAEMSIIRDLFANTAKAAQLLNTDQAFARLLATTRTQIQPYRIGKQGQLQEWADDVDMDAEDIHHRHVSHLYDLFPGKDISPRTSPELAAAARQTLEIRGDDATGWSLAWKINLWAHLLDGDRAYKLITKQLKLIRSKTINYGAGGGTYPNLFDAHPPFQIDGNFGFVSGVSEMLLQSDEEIATANGSSETTYILDLLPALPAQWKEGSIKGLKARNNFEVGIDWKEHRLNKATILSNAGRDCVVRTKTAVKLENSDIASQQEGDSFILTFKTVEGQTYSLIPAL